MRSIPVSEKYSNIKSDRIVYSGLFCVSDTFSFTPAANDMPQ